MPDHNDPDRMANVAAIRALRGPEREEWLVFSNRYPPIDGNYARADPALHYDETLAAFFQSRE